MDKEIIENLPAMLETIRKIKKDCLDIKKHSHDLTEYGEGQLGLIYIVLEELGLD